MFRDLKKQGELNWEEHCYIPIAGTLAIVAPDADSSNDLIAHPEIIIDSAKIAAAAPWRIYKQIYSFREEMELLLYEQVDDCMLPVEILFNLPFPCIYIEIKCMNGINGFFVHFESDEMNQRMELRLLILMDNMHTLPLAIHIGQGMTIKDGVNAMFSEAKRIASTHGDVLAKKAQKAEEIEYELNFELAKMLIQLVLYICAQNVNTLRQLPNIFKLLQYAFLT